MNAPYVQILKKNVSGVKVTMLHQKGFNPVLNNEIIASQTHLRKCSNIAKAIEHFAQIKEAPFNTNCISMDTQHTIRDGHFNQNMF